MTLLTKNTEHTKESVNKDICFLRVLIKWLHKLMEEQNCCLSTFFFLSYTNTHTALAIGHYGGPPKTESRNRKADNSRNA